MVEAERPQPGSNGRPAAEAPAFDDAPPGPQHFPRGPVAVAAALVLAHLAIVLALIVRGPGAAQRMFRAGALASGRTWHEPWRLVTSLFLHVDVPHVLWNGVSMVVFAVPLLVELGYAQTGLIYLAAGLGGAMTAVTFAPAGTTIVGSSGAVAGLFGAWVVTALSRAREEPLTWRARVRTLGVAMLVLPSLLSPVTSTGRPVSVGSHLGGLAMGMFIGALLSQRMARRRPVAWSVPFPE